MKKGIFKKLITKKLNITQVCWYKVFPAVAGGQKGITHFYEALCKVANNTLICSNNNTTASQNILPILPKNKWQFLQSKNYKLIIETIKKNNSNIVIVEHPYYYLLYKWCKKNNCTFVVHSHNIEYKRLQKTGKWYWPLVYCIEKKAMQKSDYILCKTIEDSNFFAKHWNIPLHKLLHLPYGIQQLELPAKSDLRNVIIKKCDLNEKVNLYLFAASFNYLPNQKALLHLLNDIWPAILLQNKNAHLIICGTFLEDFLQKNKIKIPLNITIAGCVNNIQEYMKACDVFINPVQIGEGIQTKCLESLAQHCTVVMYDCVANGMPIYLKNQKLFIANNTEQFIEYSTFAIANKNIVTAAQFYQDFDVDLLVQKLLQKITSKG